VFFVVVFSFSHEPLCRSWTDGRLDQWWFYFWRKTGQKHTDGCFVFFVFVVFKKRTILKMRFYLEGKKIKLLPSKQAKDILKYV